MSQSPPQTTLRPVWWASSDQGGSSEAIGPSGALQLIDQTRLPAETVILTCRSLDSVWQAIKQLQVRGGPAIGVAAAFGVVVGLDEAAPDDRTWGESLQRVCDHLATSRPTAVNLFWAIDRMRKKGEQL